MEFLIGLAVGLLVGWNVAPQPEFAKTLFDYIAAKFTTKTK